MTDKNDDTETTGDEAEETIVAMSEGGEPGSTRTIRIYDKGRGDFHLQIPSESTVTFGYFNPMTANNADDRYGVGRGGQTIRTTALRVYAKGAKSSQLGCFLGVEGFRDLSLKLTRLRQKVVIESNFEDDGDGNSKFEDRRMRALNAVVEDDEAPF